jgi:hypothetical protein
LEKSAASAFADIIPRPWDTRQTLIPKFCWLESKRLFKEQIQNQSYILTSISLEIFEPSDSGPYGAKTGNNAKITL